MTEPTTLQVGKPLVPGRTAWPEQADFNYYDGGAELCLFSFTPSVAEVEAVRVGPCDFALAPSGDVLFLLYRFGRAGAGVPWSDAPFSWHLVPEGRRQLPPAPGELSPDTRELLLVILTDAATGLVRVLRAVSLAPDFTRALFAAVAAQAAAPWCGPAAYDRQLAEAYRRWPSSNNLLTAAVARCAGGA
jgi:hypothetical protein